MKKLLLILITILSGSIVLSQNEVILQVHHKLGEEDFELNKEATNNLGNAFKLSRVQYYMSEISIVHDGGIRTEIEDLWLLFDASLSSEISLGDHSIEKVEAIHFSIGVDPDHNHSDPAAYPSDHALAPKNPSMHWGWAAGYRFIAYEGLGGQNLNQVFQLHGLWDQNYIPSRVFLDSEAESGVVRIDLDADYTRALEDIDVSSGLIQHGDNLMDKRMIENYKNFVFSPSDETTPTKDIEDNFNFNVFPNPSANGIIYVEAKADSDFQYQVEVTDVLGKQVFNQLEFQSNVVNALDLESSGTYYISFLRDGKLLFTKTIIAI